eukprot:1672904-Prymnesium_polylepis.1
MRLRSASDATHVRRHARGVQPRRHSGGDVAHVRAVDLHLDRVAVMRVVGLGFERRRAHALAQHA